MSKRTLGRHHTEETKKKISLSHIGMKYPPEFGMKQRLLKLGTTHIVTVETRQKISAAHTGRKHTLESRKHMSEAHLGVQAKEKHPLWGTHRSDETKLKLKQYRGTKHWNWTGGSKEYCDKWNREFRNRISLWNAYNHNGTITCEGCSGVHNGHRGFNRHHVYFDKKACCAVNEEGIYYSNLGIKGASHNFKIDGDPNKFVVLCDKCHAKTIPKQNRVYWARYYEKIVNEKYNGKSYFTKEEMNGVL